MTTIKVGEENLWLRFERGEEAIALHVDFRAGDWTFRACDMRGDLVGELRVPRLKPSPKATQEVR